MRHSFTAIPKVNYGELQCRMYRHVLEVRLLVPGASQERRKKSYWITGTQLDQEREML